MLSLPGPQCIFGLVKRLGFGKITPCFLAFSHDCLISKIEWYSFDFYHCYNNIKKLKILTKFETFTKEFNTERKQIPKEK